MGRAGKKASREPKEGYGKQTQRTSREPQEGWKWETNAEDQKGRQEKVSYKLFVWFYRFLGGINRKPALKEGSPVLGDISAGPAAAKRGKRQLMGPIRDDTHRLKPKRWADSYLITIGVLFR